MDLRRPDEHRDQVAPGRRSRPPPAAGSRAATPRARAAPTASSPTSGHHEVDEHAGDDRARTRRPRIVRVEAPRPRVAEPHRERPLARGLVGGDVADVVRLQDRDREQPHDRARTTTRPPSRSRPSRTSSRTSPRARRTRTPSPRRARAPRRGAGRRCRATPRRSRARRPPGSARARVAIASASPAKRRDADREQRRGRAPRAGDAAPLCVSRGGPTRSCVSTPADAVEVVVREVHADLQARGDERAPRRTATRSTSPAAAVPTTTGHEPGAERAGPRPEPPDRHPAASRPLREPREVRVALLL